MPRGIAVFRDLGPHDWMADAACSGTTVDFFPTTRGVQRLEVVAAPAKAICRECVVREECLDYALAINERYGIWGGMTPEERREIIL